MTTIWLYAIGSVLLISVISLIGLFTIWFTTSMGRKILVMLVGLSAGALLGDVFIHLLPELVENCGFNLNTSLYILGAIMVFFILENYLHWHHHHGSGEAGEHATHPFVYNNLIGDGVHNLIDGLIIGGAYLIDINLGIATTIAVAFHEIPQEIGDFGVLVYGGFSKAKALFFNFISALTALVGVVIALTFGTSEKTLSFLAALAIGSFLYIASADLIPQIHKEKHKSIAHVASFALGIALMFGLLLLE
jgi:zinc and cadmium transporter